MYYFMLLQYTCILQSFEILTSINKYIFNVLIVHKYLYQSQWKWKIKYFNWFFFSIHSKYPSWICSKSRCKLLHSILNSSSINFIHLHKVRLPSSHKFLMNTLFLSTSNGTCLPSLLAKICKVHTAFVTSGKKESDSDKWHDPVTELFVYRRILAKMAIFVRMSMVRFILEVYGKWEHILLQYNAFWREKNSTEIKGIFLLL